MMRPPLLLVLTLQVAILTGCKEKAIVKTSVPQLVIERGSVSDFYEVLEGMKVLVADGRALLEIRDGESVDKLVFMSVDGFPARPVLVHVSQDVVAIGSGISREALGLDELHQRLKRFVDGVSHIGHQGAILLISDDGVSGEFGLSVLDVISQSGVEFIMLSVAEYSLPSSGRSEGKPSPPYSIRKDAEQIVPPKSARAGG